MERDHELGSGDQAYIRGYLRGMDIATARAESRRRLGLPIERDSDAYRLLADGEPRLEGDEAVCPSAFGFRDDG